MAEKSKTPSKPDPAPALVAGAESTDPAVQQLLAERAGHELNRSAHGAAREVKTAADEAIAAIDKRLGELGFN